MEVVWCQIGHPMGDLWDLGSQPVDQGSLHVPSQKFLLAAGMYTAMFSDAGNMLGHIF